MNISETLKYFRRVRRAGYLGEYLRHTFAEKLCALAYPKYKFTDVGRLYLDDKEFIAYFEKFEGNKHYHTLDRKYALNELLKLVSHVPGDTAECGAYKGASSYLICRSIAGSNKKHHIFDSFAGLSEPRREDGGYWEKADLVTSEEVIRRNLAEFDYVEYHKGWIPERFNDVSGASFSFVHVDVDLLEPTRDSLEFFYPRMNRGGMMLFDDYGFRQCPGAKRAIDEFFKTRPEKIVLLPTGQAFVIRRGA